MVRMRDQQLAATPGIVKMCARFWRSGGVGEASAARDILKLSGAERPHGTPPRRLRLSDGHKVIMVEEGVDEAGPVRLGFGGLGLRGEEVAAGSEFCRSRTAGENLLVGGGDEGGFVGGRI